MLVLFAILLVGCGEGHVGEVKIVCSPDHPCNLHIIAPLQLDRAAISVDGVATTWLMSEDVENPILELVRRFFGTPKRTFVSGTAHAAKGRHTIRIVKQGWLPVERVVEVDDPNVSTGIEICAADVRPLMEHAK
ncbi:MAG TPA: hypothetical protein VI670_18870 [Thermoanaerobaculia bacterium]